MTTEFESKDRLLELAQLRFFQTGFNKVTMDELSSELGVSKKTFYKFFPSKDDLLRATVHLVMRSMEKRMEEIVSSNKQFAEKMADVMTLVGKLTNKMSKAFQSDIQRFAPSLWKEIEKFRREQILNKVEKMIHQAREEGIFRDDINEKILLLMILSCVQGIINPEVLVQNSFSAEEAFRTIFNVLFKGAMSDSARKNFHSVDVQQITI